MKKWEYAQIDLGVRDHGSTLDHMGINGWDLVSSVWLPPLQVTRHYLKRALSEVPDYRLDFNCQGGRFGS